MTALVKSSRHNALATQRVDALTVMLVAAQRAKTIGARMKERRIELGKTQPEIANAIGVPSVTKDYVSRWERGAVEPSEAYLELAAKALETTVADLMAGPVSARKATDGITPDLLGAASDDFTQLDRIEAKLGAIMDHLGVSPGVLPSPPGVLAQRRGSSSSSAPDHPRRRSR